MPCIFPDHILLSPEVPKEIAESHSFDWDDYKIERGVPGLKTYICNVCGVKLYEIDMMNKNAHYTEHWIISVYQQKCHDRLLNQIME